MSNSPKCLGLCNHIPPKPMLAYQPKLCSSVKGGCKNYWRSCAFLLSRSDTHPN
ncbi:unnamed protein product [Hymenolepis diminuta]|uniref:Uncharacterized protein n=1 Tax=Hymenolepis diminuta TaxID=6216 RepID=A0A564Z9Z1_HYMDI|nr:unnamed protein product [Hymenolepis diminuta]